MNLGSWQQFLMSAGALWDWLLAAALAFLTEHDSPKMGWVVLALVAAAFRIARSIQATLNREISLRPDVPVAISKLEWTHTLITGPVISILAGLRFVRDLLFRRKREEVKPPRVSILVCSTGPSYVLAAAVTLGTMVLVEIADPLLRVKFGLTPGYPAWQYILLGGHVPLGEFIPLQRSPWTAAFLTVSWWVFYWSVAARAVRILLARTIGTNLADSREDDQVLSVWRSPLGCSLLHEPDESFRSWARWPALIAVPLLGTSWMALGAQEYRLDATVYAAALVTWASLVLLQTLRGIDESPAGDVLAPAEPQVTLPDWLDAEADLRERLHLAPLVESGPRVRIPDLQIPRAGTEPTPPWLSGLIPALLSRGSGKKGLTRFQEIVLAHLSGEKPSAASPDVLALAPEGYGKTTLARFAVCNEALLRSAPSLVVCRDEAAADAFRSVLSAWVEPATLQWYLRARRAGPELMEELSRQIVPDAVVATLEELVVQILGDPEPYHDFLREVALIVVDDIESYCGPVECHCQLAFRRLRERIRSLAGPEAAAPRLLVLGTESMMGMEAWAESLVGVDLAVRQEECREEPAVEGAPHIRTVSLSDFSSVTGEAIGVLEIVEACERTGVPWHYRPAGDSQRSLGLQCLRLPKTPVHHVDDPLDAATVVVQGPHALVHRELMRLRRAGCRYVGTDTVLSGKGVAALISAIDADEQSALLEMDQRGELAALIRPLPRPFIRVPARPISNAHAAAELVDNWMETENVFRIFNPEIVPILKGLAQDGLLLTEERTELSSASSSWERLLFIRVRAEAVADGSDSGRDSSRLLPPRVSRVEDSTDHPVPVRDVSSGRVLRFVDPGAAVRVYFPGRIAADIRGRFIVAGVSQETENGVLVEPYTAAEISVPRRRSYFDVTQGSGGTKELPRHGVQFGAHGIDLWHTRVECRTVHVATIYLGSSHHELRRIVFSEPSVREAAPAFPTDALFLYPNTAGDDGPKLTLASARLVAAAMGMALPSLFRASEESVDISLSLTGDGDPPPEHELASEDAFVFCDLHVDGNGACRAMNRETIELLLRLSRMAIERILGPERLLLRHDQWGSEAELRRILRPEGAGVDTQLVGIDLEEVRRQALVWLDSRLRPEGTPAVMSALAAVASGRQSGEGDLFDLGRVWNVEGDCTAGLAWARHRWRERPGKEGMLDYGIDRRIVLQQDMPENATPREDPESTQIQRGPLDLAGKEVTDPLLAKFHRRVLDAVREGMAVTNDLVEVLALEREAGPSARDRMRAFVQAIPTTVPVTASSLRSPSWVLLRREGDEISKAVLLACLLRRIGEETGLLVSLEEKRGALALPIAEVPLEGRGSAAKKAVEAWAKSAGLGEPPSLFSTMPPERENGMGKVFVPVGMTGYVAPGIFRVEKPESWVFLPLGDAWKESGNVPEQDSAR